MSNNQNTRGENIRYSKIVVHGFSIILLVIVIIFLLVCRPINNFNKTNTELLIVKF